MRIWLAIVALLMAVRTSAADKPCPYGCSPGFVCKKNKCEFSGHCPKGMVQHGKSCMSPAPEPCFRIDMKCTAKSTPCTSAFKCINGFGHQIIDKGDSCVASSMGNGSHLDCARGTRCRPDKRDQTTGETCH